MPHLKWESILFDMIETLFHFLPLILLANKSTTVSAILR